MGKANITATNVILPALGPIFLMYMSKTLSGEKSNNFYQCDNTSTTFSHLKTHIGDQGNKCNLCNYATAETRDLSQHIMACRGEKPHKCYLCKYSASLEGNLKRHI